MKTWIMKSSTKIVIIAAMSENRVIGVDGELPWHYPKDMQRFKHLTSGNPVIFGRKTHENIVSSYGSTLPDRTHIVVTTSPNTDSFADDVITAGSVDEAIAAGREICSTTRQGSAIYIAGGESIYNQTIDTVDQIELTEIHATYDGDAFFPELDADVWSEIYREEHDEMDFITLVNQDQTTGNKKSSPSA